MEKYLRKIINRLLYLVYFFLTIFIRKKRNYWAFSVHFIQGSFSDNNRAVYESVKRDNSIRKFIFVSDKGIDIKDDEYTKIINISKLSHILKLAKCDVVYVQHSLLFDYKIKSWFLRRILLKRARVIQLWHAIPFKYVQSQDKTARGVEENKYYSLISASSDMAKLMLGNAFSPIAFNKIISIGQPKDDFLFKEMDELPESYKKQLNMVKQIKGGKKLVLYSPTYRETTEGGDYYSFTDYEVKQLRRLAEKHNLIFGFRYHYYINSNTSFVWFIDNKYFFDLSNNIISELAMILREADIVISDYSSFYLDAVMLHKPIISFAYDYDHYKNIQRGMYIDIISVFPGKIATNFDELISNLNAYLYGNEMFVQYPEYIFKLFSKYRDSNNAKRLVDYITNINL